MRGTECTGQGMCSELKHHLMLPGKWKTCLRGSQGLTNHAALQPQGLSPEPPVPATLSSLHACRVGCKQPSPGPFWSCKLNGNSTPRASEGNAPSGDCRAEGLVGTSPQLSEGKQGPPPALLRLAGGVVNESLTYQYYLM